MQINIRHLTTDIRSGKTDIREIDKLRNESFENHKKL